MKLIANKNFTHNGNYYFKNDEIELKKIKYEDIVRMNENGFIKPLCLKELVQVKKELEQPKFFKKEEE